MRNPFRRSPPTVVVNNLGPTDAETKIAHLEDQVKSLTAECEEVADINNRRSLRLHVQMETSDVQTVESRMDELLGNERKLLAVARLLSGEDVETNVILLREMGNRLGMSSPTVEGIYARLDALQSLAPLRDQIRTCLASIDWESVEFEFEEDENNIHKLIQLVR